ncbi:hypothetical protein GCM10022285_60680 [Streptomyces tunisiensis]|uniref:Uncharacterized protein n=1 Tax=Streptomyces tunisiensis TaxID=948699 RepID=A0ABP7Z907_9ACTN
MGDTGRGGGSRNTLNRARGSTKLLFSHGEVLLFLDGQALARESYVPAGADVCTGW